MTTTLRQVLTAFEQADAPLSLADLARRLDVSPEMVENMIHYWVRKGKLRESTDTACTPGESACASCGIGKNGCPFVVTMPRSFELVS